MPGLSEPKHARAAVLRESRGPFHFETIDVDEPGIGEILVRVVATGMCHTDAVVRSGDLPTPLPVVLGHEGAGIVQSAGPGVTKVVPGDHVVLTFSSCGLCETCLSGRPSACHLCFPLNFGGSRLDGTHAVHSPKGVLHDRFFGQSSFSELAIATERNVVKVPKEAPIELLGPLGCGIQTGAGAVLNSFRIRAGESLVVFGAGAVGMAAIMAAKAAGAATIIAVDVILSRLSLAQEIGATDVIDGRAEDNVAAIKAITQGGAHFSLDTTGRSDVMRRAVDCLRPGATCGVLGAGAPGQELALDYNAFMGLSKVLRGIVAGDSVPEIFIPQLVELYRQGRFPFDRLIKFYSLQEMNMALEDSAAGRTIKPVIRMPSE